MQPGDGCLDRTVDATEEERDLRRVQLRRELVETLA
jgi:hypothetical protein